jgi:hypothetical protein
MGLWLRLIAPALVDRLARRAVERAHAVAPETRRTNINKRRQFLIFLKMKY